MAEAKITGIVFDFSEPQLGTFLNLVTPKRMKVRGVEKGDPFFSINVEIEETSKDLPRLRTAISDAAHELFPSLDLGAAIASKSFNVPLQNGDVLADGGLGEGRKGREWSRGKFVLTCRSKEDYPPNLTIVQGGKVVDVSDKDARKSAERANFYSGQRVLVGVRLKAYDGVNDGKPGVKAYLEAVHSCGGGEKLFGGADPVERFRDYTGHDTQVDPTGATASGEW